MLKVPPALIAKYDRLLVNSDAQPKKYPAYRKWLRYYLDFCKKELRIKDFNFDQNLITIYCYKDGYPGGGADQQGPSFLIVRFFEYQGQPGWKPSLMRRE